MSPSAESRAFAERFQVPRITTEARDLFEDDNIEAVLICSSTNTHADYVAQAARAGKSIFCEKPLDLSLDKVRQTLDVVKEANVPLMLAFNQRFDNNFAAARESVHSGTVGDIHAVHIISRDPGPPPISYIRDSGGLFVDMMIHDFDMARFITGSEVVEVFAKGHNLVDPEIGKAGDIDTGVVVLTFANNATAIIQNSRKAVYGYDQRLEIFGSRGLIRVENPLKSTATFYDEHGGHHARHMDFFMDRYRNSYLREIEAFIDAVRNGKSMPATGEDGLKAMLIADAARRSMIERRPVTL